MIITEDSKPPGESYVAVADFYAGKSIFITGGTGFVGKVLTEKLLYSCPDVGNIYLLVREKKNQSAQERFSSYYDCSMFDRLSKKSPENLKKIKFINGDLTQADAGLSPRDLKILQEEVSIVFHLAATVKFNEPLSTAMRANLEGTEKVLKLCRNMKKIQVFVYMSTIFSYTNHERTMIEERLYPTPMPLHQVYTMIRDNDDKEVFHPDVLDGRPNTYTFTKALAEHLIATERGDIPTVIIRPSIVTPALEEPVKGWVANWMGPTPILYLMGKGWCRCVYGKGDNPLEIIPVDHVVNLTIIAAARYERSAENDIPIYHCCTSSSNPVTIKETDVYFAKACRKQGFNDFPFPGVIVTTSSLVFTVMSFIFQVLPSYIADFFLLITGKPARFVNIQKKVAKAAIATRYFKTQRFLMTNRRSQALFESLSSEDQRTFPCDSTNINWEDYMATYLHGIRKYLLK